MIKIVAAIRRRPGMTHAEYLDYVEHIHGGLANGRRTSLGRYVQNHVFDGGFGASDGIYPSYFHRDSVTELFFESFEKMGQTFNDPYVRDVVQPDGVNFSDLASAISVLTMEKVEQAPPPPGVGVKVLHFQAGTVGGDAFAEAWGKAHADAMAALPQFKQNLRGQAYSFALPPPPAGGADYFGGGDMPRYDAVSSFWFDGEADLVQFRRYERALSASGLLNTAASFFLYAREVLISDTIQGEG